MRFHQVIVAALAAVSLPSTEAFTLGSMLLPSYLCGPAKANATTGVITGIDGKPKALGGVLSNLVEYTLGKSEHAYDPVTDPMLFLGAMHNANAAVTSKQFFGIDRIPKVPDAIGADIAEPLQPGAVNDYNSMNIPVAAQKNILDVVPISAIPNPVTDPATNVTTDGVMLFANVQATTQKPMDPTLPFIRPNQKNIMSLRAKNNDVLTALGALAVTQNVFMADNNGLALDGAIVYAQDAKNNRLGVWVTGGANADVWSACGGVDGRGGIVHNQLLSDTNVYNGPEFFLPWQYGVQHPGNSTITFMGAAVTDNGFGFHQTQVKVVSPAPLALNLDALNPLDVLKCLDVTTPAACVVSCLDCIKQAGSKSANKAKYILANSVFLAGTAQLTCTFDKNAGNPFMNAGQQTIWSASCAINKKAATIVQPGTGLNLLKTLDAEGFDMPLTVDQQNAITSTQQFIAAVNNGTDPTATQTQNNPATQPTCNSNNVNTATQSQSINWFTTITVALGTLLAARQ